MREARRERPPTRCASRLQAAECAPARRRLCPSPVHPSSSTHGREQPGTVATAFFGARARAHAFAAVKRVAAHASSVQGATLLSVLSLDDPRWLSLDHRNWSEGRRSEDDPQIPFVPDELRRLAANPTDHERFEDLWPYLASEDTAWPAAYAAVPHLVAIAQGLRPHERGNYLYVVGWIVICSGAYGETGRDVPADVADAYRKALSTALELLIEQLATPHKYIDTRYLLAATAALKGHAGLGELLNNLDTYAECQSCGEPVFDLEAEDGLAP